MVAIHPPQVQFQGWNMDRLPNCRVVRKFDGDQKLIPVMCSVSTSIIFHHTVYIFDRTVCLRVKAIRYTETHSI